MKLDRVWDVGTFVGEWPFYPLPGTHLEDLRKEMEALGVERAFVSSVRCAFYKDLWPENLRLLRGAGGWLRVLACVNPAFPGWREDLRESRDMGCAGVRAFPSYHGFSPDDPEGIRLLEACADAGLPVFITFRIRDERSHPPASFVPPVDSKSVARALDAVPGAKVVLSLVRLHEALAVADSAKDPGNLFVEVSGIQGPMSWASDLKEAFPAGNILFGSAMLIQYPYPALLKVVENEDLSEGEKQAVLRENALRLFGPT